MKRIYIVICFLCVAFCSFGQCPVSAIVNGGFEQPYQAPGTYSLTSDANVQGWTTTAADHMMEFWGTGFNGVPSYEGNQFVEINANLFGALYQDIVTTPGDTLYWQCAHRARVGIDVMTISIGPPGATVLQATCSDGTSAWQLYSGYYIVPPGQTLTRFEFLAVSTGSGSPAAGNFIDGVGFTKYMTQIVCENDGYTFNNGTATSAPGIYSDIILDNNGCPNSVTLNLVVYPVPRVTLTETICAGDSVFTGNSWKFAPGTYADTLVSALGCDSIVTTSLTVIPLPVTYVFDTICGGNIYTLPSGMVVNMSGVYNDTLATSACDSIVVTVLTVLQIPLTEIYDTVCGGTNYTLPSGTVVAITGTYSDTFQTALCDSIVIVYLTVNPVYSIVVNDTVCAGTAYVLPDGSSVNSTGVYTVTLQNQFGCDSVVTTNLWVDSLTLAVTGTGVLCNGDNNGSITALASSGAGSYIYTLSVGGNAISYNNTGSFTGLAGGSYIIDAVDDFGCSATNNILINEPPAIQPSAAATDAGCYGEREGTITLTASGGTPSYTYSISGFPSNSSGFFNLLAEGSYAYTITDANGCTATASITVGGLQQITLSVTPASVTMDLGESVQLNATCNCAGANYLWAPATGLSCTHCPNPVASLNSSIDYRVEVQVSAQGKDCWAYVDVPLTVIPNYNVFIPNAFTPNGDGMNDVFEIFGNTQAMKFVEVSVFNRIGEKVFEANDIHFKWDGTYKGKPLQPQVLVYNLFVGFIDNHTEKAFTGSLTLVK